jgi:hypothetical protein
VAAWGSRFELEAEDPLVEVFGGDEVAGVEHRLEDAGDGHVRSRVDDSTDGVKATGTASDEP